MFLGSLELPKEAQLVGPSLEDPDGDPVSQESGGQAWPASVLGPSCELRVLGHHSPMRQEVPFPSGM